MRKNGGNFRRFCVERGNQSENRRGVVGAAPYGRINRQNGRTNKRAVRSLAIFQKRGYNGSARKPFCEAEQEEEGMEIPVALTMAIASAAQGRKIRELGKISDGISERYRTAQRRGERLLATDEEALVYSIVRMPATFGAVASVLERLPEGDYETLLDVGAGTGGATWAAAETLGIAEADCLEREKAMIRMGERLFSEGGLGAKVRWIEADLTAFTAKKRYDLVIAAYALNELSPSARRETVKKLFSYAKKCLVIVEPGTPDAFCLQRELRSTLREAGAYLVAPCPHGEDCPLTDDWCHFTCRIPRTSLHRLVKGGDSPFEDEKFTYTIASVKESARAESRVIRHPVTAAGSVTLKLCKADKTIGTEQIGKGDPRYKRARKVRCGDEF
ncbi:MAG: small ribosomal subunit Rsm22 family protein [Christensenellaceae bacterium]